MTEIINDMRTDKKKEKSNNDTIFFYDTKVGMPVDKKKEKTRFRTDALGGKLSANIP